MRRWLPFGAKAAVSIGLLVFIADKIDLQRILLILGGTSWAFFFLAFLVIAIQAFMAVERWRQVLVHQKIQLSFFSLARFFWFGLFFNQVMPSSIGGDAVRAYCLVRNGCTLVTASVTVLLDRMLGVMGVVLLVVVCFPFSFSLIANEAMRWGIILVVILALSAVAGVLFLDQMTAGIRRWRIARGMGTLSRDAKDLLLSSSLGGRLVLLSVAVQIMSVLALAILALAIRFEVNWIVLLIVLPLATLLMTIPISIAGWGVREGVMVVGLGFAGADTEQAAALSILFGLLVLAIALPGGMFWLAGIRPQEKMAEKVSETR